MTVRRDGLIGAAGVCAGSLFGCRPAYGGEISATLAEEIPASPVKRCPIVASKRQQEELSRRAVRLTPAELRVLSLLPTHLTLNAIAEQVDRRRSTVKAHVEHIYKKLGAHSRGEAVARARERGLLVAADAGTVPLRRRGR
jgi:DNA-binding NarL/FixJ family response regulator